ncbi:MAG TPA: hypothetical protein DCS43_13905 [Verrucomicrobia bacterium]|nr:hypothetical protein [Verrucomicrobiota bacterium]
MLTCKQVSKVLAEGDYMDLPPFKRFMLMSHVSLCFVCRGFNRGVMTFQDLARAFRAKEETLPFGDKLPDDARRKMMQAIRENTRKP